MTNPRSKDVHTTLSYDLWLKAQIKGINWSEALEVGIQSLMGIEPNEEEVLLSEINKLSIELSLKQKKLLDFRQQIQQQQQDHNQEAFEEKVREAKSFKLLNPLRHQQ